MPLGPSHGDAAKQIESCGECHRLPGRLRPEEVRPDNPVLARFPSVGLVRSKCYTASKGGLSCTTCHDAHSRISTDAVAYEESCLSCHGEPPQRPCPVSPARGCVGCHMPKRDVGRGLSLTDHWIRPHESRR
jgi:hypothetical protein